MKSKVYLVLNILCLVITVTLIIVNNGWVSAASSEAGSIEDPLVTKSYVDEQIRQLQENGSVDSTNNASTDSDMDMVQLVETINRYIDNQMTAFQNQVSSQLSNSTGTFKVVALNEGQKLIANEGAEIIVRTGQVTAISNESGNGITDVTEGVDLATGDMVQLNHLLIVPRSDGRGIEGHSLSYIMIKGSYEIVE